MEKEELFITENGVKEYNQLVVSKSNILITAGKSESTVKTQKVLDLAIAKLDVFKTLKPGEGLSVVLTKREIERVLGTTNDKLYYEMNNEITPNLAANNTYYLNNDAEEKCGFFVLIDKAIYSKGELKINFGIEASRYLQDLQNSKEGYTSYLLSNTYNIKNPYAYNLYILLRKELFRIKKGEHAQVYYDFNQLKFIIGIYNLEHPDLRKVKIAYQKGERNYDLLTDMIRDIYKEKGENMPYDRPFNFKARVLNVAETQMNKNTDIYITYESVTRGNKIVGFIFDISRNDQNKEKIRKHEQIIEETLANVNVNEDEKYRCIDFIVDYFDIKPSEAKQFAKMTKYNLNCLKEVYAYYSAQPKEIENVPGWLYRCITEGWYMGQTTWEDYNESDSVEDANFEEIMQPREV